MKKTYSLTEEQKAKFFPYLDSLLESGRMLEIERIIPKLAFRFDIEDSKFAYHVIVKYITYRRKLAA